jgi:hypothetical protein
VQISAELFFCNVTVIVNILHKIPTHPDLDQKAEDKYSKDNIQNCSPKICEIAHQRQERCPQQQCSCQM